MVAYVILFWVAITSAEEEFEDYFGLHDLPLVGIMHESSSDDDTAEKVLVSNYRCVNFFHLRIFINVLCKYSEPLIRFYVGLCLFLIRM